MIFIAGISIALFFEVLLLSKKNKTHSDHILLLWMLFVCIHLFLFYMLYTEKSYDYPFLLGLSIPLPFIHGVSSYFYVASATNQYPRKFIVRLLHFSPAILSFLYLIPFYLKSADEKIEVFKNEGAGYETFLSIQFIAICVFGLAYAIWSLILLKKHRQNIQNQYANTEKVNLNWLRFLIIGLALIWLVAILTNEDFIIFLCVTFYVFIVGFFGIRQTAIVETEDEKIASKKYAKSGLKEDQSIQLYQALQNYISTHKDWYKKSDLHINELAGALNVHSNYLSQLINEREGMNFYEYVNSYRLEAFKKIAQKPESRRLTLLALAFECGFNSKSSFNRYIKKATDLTPTEYYKTLIPKE